MAPRGRPSRVAHNEQRSDVVDSPLKTSASLLSPAQAPTADPTTRADIKEALTTPLKRRLDDDDNDTEPTAPAKRKRRGKLGRKECSICCTDYATNQFPKLPHQDASTHDNGVCRKCWELHLMEEISSKGWDAAACPQCTEVLSEAELRKIASEKTYGEWLDKAAKACGESSEEYRPCPRAECTWACFFSTEDGNIFVCQLCKYRHCVLCEVAMHDDETCAEYQARKADEEQREEGKARQVKENEDSEKVVQGISKPCPKCGRQLDKYTGCDHVTCRTCNHEFCWLCFAPYRGSNGIDRAGNTAHTQTCHYHPRSLPDAGNVPQEVGDDEF